MTCPWLTTRGPSGGWWPDASPGLTWTFFEINPVVERIARTVPSGQTTTRARSACSSADLGQSQVSRRTSPVEEPG